MKPLWAAIALAVCLIAAGIVVGLTTTTVSSDQQHTQWYTYESEPCGSAAIRSIAVATDSSYHKTRLFVLCADNTIVWTPQ